MTVTEFKSELKSLHGGYLFLGEEDYLKIKYLQSVSTELFPDDNGYFDTVNLTADNFSSQKLGDEIISPPFISEKKLIILRDMRLEEYRDDDLNELKTALEPANENGSVIIILFLSASESDYLKEKKPQTVKALSKMLAPVEFNHEEPQKLAKWVSRHFSENGVFADLTLCSKIIEICGCDMFTLKNEADKLSAYVLSNGRDHLTDDDVNTAVSSNLDIGAFDFANAILNRDRKLAFAILSRYKLKKYPPELILSGVSKTICDIYSVKLLLNEGDRSETIASKLSIHPYKAKLYCKAAQPCDINRLQYLISVCEKTDVMVKSSGLNNYTLLEGLTAETLSR